MQIALTGMEAAKTRLAVSADNIANIRSTGGEGYIPKQVEQVSNPLGGTTTSVRHLQSPFVKNFLPNHVHADDDGFVSLPNVDIAQEATNQILAKHSYQASAKMFQTADKVMDYLLDITS